MSVILVCTNLWYLHCDRVDLMLNFSEFVLNFRKDMADCGLFVAIYTQQNFMVLKHVKTLKY